MFGLSWGQIAIIVLVGVFVLGPERIPTAVSWVLTGARKVRTMASGAQADLVRELGPEIADLRRQIGELQSLRLLPELREMLDLDAGRLIADPLRDASQARPSRDDSSDDGADDSLGRPRFIAAPLRDASQARPSRDDSSDDGADDSLGRPRSSA